MSKREIIQAMVLSLLVFTIWAGANVWWFKHHPQVASTVAPTTEPSEVPSTTEPATQPATAGAGLPSSMPATTWPSSIPAAAMVAGLHAVPSTQPSDTSVTLGSNHVKDPNYALQLSLTPIGAAVADVTLNDFPAANDARVPKSEKTPYVFESPLAGRPGSEVLGSRSIVIDGNPAVDLSGVPWQLESSSIDSATFSITLADAGGPVAQIFKTFHVASRAASAQTSKGFEIAVDQKIASLRPGHTLKVREIFNGPTPPPAEIEQGTDRSIMVGYNEAGGNIVIKEHSFGEFKPDKPGQDLSKNSDNLPFQWAGQISSYFCAIVAPDKDQTSLFTVHADAPDPQEDLNQHSTVQRVGLTLETTELSVGDDKPVDLSMTAYFGPKWRQVLDTDYYRAWPRKYSQILTYSGSFCGFCAFPFLITLLVWILTGFHWIFHDWGLAIIGLVLLVRTLLHPITRRSQVQMMKMGKMTPEIEKLKKKYADRPDELNKEMMKIYKEQGGAILGCLPMFLQTPIWIALWTGLRSTFELRQEPFLFGWTWIKDLAKPDALVSFGGPIKILFFTIYGINILPLLMAAVTYINQRYFMPMPIAATPEQEQQQKMQRTMSLVFPLMFYSLPSGLNLYYLTSMSLGILESKIIRDHIKEREEAEKAGRVIIPTKATRAARKRDGRPETDADENPGLMTKMIALFAKAMEDAQKRAEEIKREQDKSNRRNNK